MVMVDLMKLLTLSDTIGAAVMVLLLAEVLFGAGLFLGLLGVHRIKNEVPNARNASDTPIEDP